MPEFGDYGTWILVVTLFPFVIYIVFMYKTDFLKSRHEGIFGSFNPQIENEEKVPITEGKNERKEEKESDASEIDEKSKDLTQISDEEQIIHVKNN